MQKRKERIQGLYHNKETHELCVLGIVEHDDMTTSWFVNIAQMYDEQETETRIERIEFDFNDTVASVKNVLRERGFYPMNQNIILCPKRLQKHFEGDLIFWEYMCRVYGMDNHSLLIFDADKVYGISDIEDLKIPWREHHWIWYDNTVDPVLDHLMRTEQIKEIRETDDEDMKHRELMVLRISHTQGQRYLFHDDGWMEEI